MRAPNRTRIAIVVTGLLTLLVAGVILVAQTPYDRDDWMPRGWLDADGDGMDLRHEILAASSLIPVATNRNASRVLSGRWVDRYTGAIATSPSALDIDHILSLAWVHERGGWDWTADKKEAFAHTPDNLVAVGLSVNRSKGARGPARWRPPRRESWCWYGATVTRLAWTWKLVLTAADRAGLVALLATCTIE